MRRVTGSAMEKTLTLIPLIPSLPSIMTLIDMKMKDLVPGKVEITPQPMALTLVPTPALAPVPLTEGHQMAASRLVT